MTSIATFVRRTPGHILQAYLDRNGIALPHIDWSGALSDTVRHVVALLDEIDEALRSKLLKDAQRIAAMTDEAGQTALLGVCRTPDAIESMVNGYARAVWMFLYEADSFRHAEEIRFTDERRRGRMWDGFIGQAGLPINTTPDAIERFKSAVRERLQSQNVHVDLFDRQRPSSKGPVARLIQATVYRDGRLDDFLDFVNGRLAWQPRRPVYEAALTYEPNSGVIEVVAGDRGSREDLVRIFAQQLLGTGADQRRLPFRQYHLDLLLRPYDFPTDPEDGIETVRVTQLRLMPLDSVGERVTLECCGHATNAIWGMAEQHFGSRDPLRGGWMVTKAKLAIRFHPAAGSRRGKTLPLTITTPHACDLKDRTEHERIVGEKYLQCWKLVKNV